MKNVNRIANYLILNSSSLTDIGLFNGKMGISIFFFHYAKYVEEEIYSEFAALLLEQVIDDITTYTPVNLQDGLCGIGWGIEYLTQQGFVRGDTDEILAELDRQIMNLDVRRISDYTLSTGLEGIIHYWLIRYRKKEKKTLPFDGQYQRDLKNKLIKDKANFADPSWVERCLDYFQTGKNQVPTFFITAIVKNNIIFRGIPEEIPVGLYSGLAGFGLKEIVK